MPSRSNYLHPGRTGHYFSFLVLDQYIILWAHGRLSFLAVLCSNCLGMGFGLCGGVVGPNHTVA